MHSTGVITKDARRRLILAFPLNKRKLPQRNARSHAEYCITEPNRGETRIFYKEVKNKSPCGVLYLRTLTHLHIWTLRVYATYTCTRNKRLLFLQISALFIHISEDSSMSDEGADLFLIIRNLLDYIIDRSWETKSPYWRPRWTRDFPSARLSLKTWRTLKNISDSLFEHLHQIYPIHLYFEVSVFFLSPSKIYKYYESYCRLRGAYTPHVHLYPEERASIFL